MEPYFPGYMHLIVLFIIKKNTKGITHIFVSSKRQMWAQLIAFTDWYTPKLSPVCRIVTLARYFTFLSDIIYLQINYTINMIISFKGLGNGYLAHGTWLLVNWHLCMYVHLGNEDAIGCTGNIFSVFVFN